MICKVLHTIQEYGMIKKGDNVTVALSGGADSMCLLSVLLSLKDELCFNLSAAHVNHGIRGAEAERDSEFVTEYCKKINVPLYSCKINVPEVSSQTGEGLEECGRRLRYEYLYKTANGGLIATAHNLNDRIETFIFNFTRGSGLNGLCSIPPVRDNIIRPLIDCSREEIEEYCKTNSIPYVTDSTNTDVDYSRNRIRHNVLPQLKSINSSFEKSAFRCIESLNCDNEFLASVADSVYEKSICNACYSTEFIKEEPAAIKSRVISKIIKEKTGIIPDSSTVYRVSDLIETGGVINIISGISLRVKNGVIDFPQQPDLTDWLSECIPGKNILPDATVEVLSVNKTSAKNTHNKQTQDLKYTIDKDKITGKIVFRNRKEGDSFRPYGRNCTKTLKKLFNENHVPAENRNRIIVCCDDERIIFVEGFGIDEKYAVTDSTDNLLSFIIRRN